MKSEVIAGAQRVTVLDAVAAVLLAAVLVIISGNIPAAPSGRSLDALGKVLVIIAALSTVLCRRRPDLAMGAVVVVAGGYVGRGYPNGPVLAVGLLVLLVLSWKSSRRTALIGAAALCAALGIGVVASHTDAVLPFFFVGWSAAVVFGTETVRSRREHLAELEERARYLELSRDSEARRRVVEERLRIARDLHDSVAHAMATINVQAGAVAHVIDRQPAVAKGAFEAIQRASGDVLDELAAMLALLRDDGETLDRAPTPGLEQIPHLVDTVRDASLEIDLLVDGPVAAIPIPIGTAAYRIVQESLTNVLRHAGATTVSVRVRAGEDNSLTVEVHDNGRNKDLTSRGTGVGIRGMRERAAATGGRAIANAAPDGGFTVLATWDGHP